MTTFSQDELRAAWSRIGMTQDGRIARFLLVDMLMMGPPLAVKSGALREHAGRMSLARDLIALLDATQSPDGTRSTDDPTVRIARTIGAAPGRARGSARRVSPYAEPDADADADAGSEPGA